MPSHASPARTILIWGVERIGDAVTTFPALKLIRAHRPAARVTCVTTDYAREVLEMSGLVDTVIALRFKGRLVNRWPLWRLSRAVRAGRYDVIFVFGKSTRYRKHIGSTDHVTQSIGGASHRAERLARAVIGRFGLGDVEIPTPRLELPADPTVAAKVAGFGVEPGRDRYMVIHAGSNRMLRGGRTKSHRGPDKTWPLDKMAAMIDHLGAAHPDLKILLVGAASERDVVERAVASRATHPWLRNLCGETGMRDLVHLLSGAELLLAGDAGVMHLGSVVGTPMVTLWGPTQDDQWAPYGMGDRVDLIRAEPVEQAVLDPDCMDKIAFETVRDAVEARLKTS